MPPMTICHRMKSFNTRMIANYKRGFGPTRVVMLLTPTRRKSGLCHVTPLQYEEVDVGQRAAIINAYLEIAPGARPHIPVDKDSSITEIENISSEYPVFRLVAGNS